MVEAQKDAEKAAKEQQKEQEIQASFDSKKSASGGK
jgi:hypothetical protein